MRPALGDLMPTYEYACTSCGHRFEAVQSFSDVSLTSCPICQGVLRKVFGSVGIVLKGSGFYKTDSRKAGSNGSRTKSDGSGSSEKAETKSAAAAKESTSSSSKDSTSTSSSPASSGDKAATSG